MWAKKSEQKIAVARERTVFPVGIFLADETCFLKVLDGSPGGFLGDAEFPGNPFYTGKTLAHHIPVVIQINVDELRPVGKLVIFIQFFEVRQLDHLLILTANKIVVIHKNI